MARIKIFMLKILHIITSLDRGGAETVLINQIRETNSIHNQNLVVSLNPSGYYVNVLHDLGIETLCLNFKGIRLALFSIFKLVRFIKKSKPDIIHTWLYHADFISILLKCFFIEKKIIWSIHTLKLDAKTSLMTIYLRRICAFFSHLIPDEIISVAEVSKLHHINIGYSKKIKVIPNGFNLSIDAIDINLKKNTLNIKDDLKIIGSVGRYHPDKDYNNLIQALSNLSSETFHAILIGRGLDYRNKELYELIKYHKLEKNITLLGERNDVNELLQIMDIFCLSSKTEAFPLVIGEAIVAKKPIIISTDVGDVKTIIAKNGFLVPPNDSVKLFHAIEKVFNMNDRKKKEIIDRAYSRICKEFGQDNYLNKVLSTYHNLLS